MGLAYCSQDGGKCPVARRLLTADLIEMLSGENVRYKALCEYDWLSLFVSRSRETTTALSIKVSEQRLGHLVGKCTPGERIT